ncbi:uncharacterized protein C20orf204 homolog isoform X2 [Sagmatias obliquidens]|uniref:uncharacterized protein C20orf204 homolog isoform X2 n=1 Tax=Sagmatias obliquidens TaxID=3371155 RepID=UPI000F4438AB|nr:putative uncharacterized protein C20orf204 homolog isoform X2 [Lagenorhynchus obliquidens]
MSPALVGMGQGMAKGETVQGVLPAVGRPRSVLPPSLMGTWALTPMQIRAAGAVVCPSPNLPALCLEHLLNGMATSPLYQLRDSLVQGPPRPALWALLLALLGAAPGRARLGACSVPDVLHHYRAVIFEDLQAAVRWTGPGSRQLHFIQKNLTGAAASRWRGRVGASCGAQKVWRHHHPSPPAPSPRGSSPSPPLPPSPGAQYPTVHRGPGSDPTWGGGRGPPRGSGKGGLDRGRAHRGGDAAPLPDAAPAEPAARDAPCSASGRPETAPAARPGRRRHLLGETLRAARRGHRRLLGLLSAPSARGLGKGLAARPLPRRGPHSSEGPGLGGGARLASWSRRGPALRPQQGPNKLSWCCGPVRSFFACQLWGQGAPGPRLGGEGALGPPAHAVWGRGERRCSQARPAGGASGRDSC